MDNTSTTKFFAVPIAALTLVVIIAIILQWPGEEPLPKEVLPDIVAASPLVVELPAEIDAQPEEAAPVAEVAPVKKRHIYRKLGLEGELLYEGDVPFKEAYVGPPPIEHSGIDNPTADQLRASALEWLDEFDAIEFDVKELKRYDEVERYLSSDRLMLVDGRMVTKFAVSDGGESSEALDELVIEFSRFSHVLNRALYTYSMDAMTAVASVPEVAAIDMRVQELKRALIDEGHNVRMSTDSISPESIHALIGEQR